MYFVYIQLLHVSYLHAMMIRYNVPNQESNKTTSHQGVKCIIYQRAKHCRAAVTTTLEIAVATADCCHKGGVMLLLL